MSSLSFALTAMSATVGLLVAIIGCLGLAPDLRRGLSASSAGLDHLPLRLGLTAGGAIGVLAITGWPVAAIYCGAAGFAFPTLTAAKRRRREAVERVEAIATWVESLRDMTAASAGIQEALRLSARVAPKPIRIEVRDLSLRLQHQPVTHSLRRFAADMHHPLTDMIVASLILASGKHAGSLQGVLAMTAKNARDSAAMWRQVESGRTRTYAQGRLAGWISFAVIALLIFTRRSFLEPFDTVAGQVALVVIGGAFFFSGVAIYRLGRPVDPRRLFAAVAHRTNAEPHHRSEPSMTEETVS